MMRSRTVPVTDIAHGAFRGHVVVGGVGMFPAGSECVDAGFLPTVSV